MAGTISRTNLFRGYSSIGIINPNKAELVDIELIKLDLLNHFHTIKGERVMRPNFGSVIWDLLFEPFDESVREAVISDVQNIIAQETRVELNSIDVFEFEQGLRIDIEVFYVPFNVLGTFQIEFDRRNGIQTTGIESF